MITFPVEVSIQIYDDIWHEGLVYDFVDLYRVLENRRMDAALKCGRAQKALVSIFIGGYPPPVRFVLRNIQRSVFMNEYGINDIERLVTDDIAAQQMFRHLSTEPHNYNTIWEELL